MWPTKVAQSIPYPASAHQPPALNPLNSNRPLRLQNLLVPLMPLPLTILQPATLMILQHAMFPTIMPVAKTAIPDDALGPLLAVFEGAADFLGGHAAEEGEGHC